MKQDDATCFDKPTWRGDMEQDDATHYTIKDGLVASLWLEPPKSDVSKITHGR